MAYQVLARKWRPQDFSGVVGQKPIVTALKNAIADSRIAQAYLFSGIRGVGKTSVARILAKALNCERGPTPEPCKECPSCLEIASGQGFDVLEFDAATYSKVDQIRELTESLKYGPAKGRYKVVILDEIHRLSRQAFDALLKIVEEPPEHLVFVFATTEPEAVPVTILSRCQEFRFRRVPHEALVAHLEVVAKGESIQASTAALRMIARGADGSVRDAVALLDQLATFGSGTIDDEAAAGILGGLGYEVLRGVLESILAGAGDKISSAVAEIEAQGWDPRHVYGEFLAYCRFALHLALGADRERLDLPAEEAVALTRLGKDAGYENLLRLLHLLLESELTVRRSESSSLAVEVAWLRAAELPKLVGLEELLAGGALGEPRATKSVKKSPAPKATPRKAAPKKKPAAKRATAPPAAAEGAAPAASPTTSGSPQGLLEKISQRKQPLAAHLAAAEAIDFADGVVTITARAGDAWLKQALARPSNVRVMDESLSELWGPGVSWRLREGRPGDASREPAGEAPVADSSSVSPRVQSVLDIFGGSVESVEEHDRSSEGLPK